MLDTEGLSRLKQRNQHAPSVITNALVMMYNYNEAIDVTISTEGWQVPIDVRILIFGGG